MQLGSAICGSTSAAIFREVPVWPSHKDVTAVVFNEIKRRCRTAPAPYKDRIRSIADD